MELEQREVLGTTGDLRVSWDDKIVKLEFRVDVEGYGGPQWLPVPLEIHRFDEFEQLDMLISALEEARGDV